MNFKITPYSKKKFFDFYEVYKKEKTRKENEVIFDQITTPNLKIIFYKNKTIYFDGILNKEDYKNLEIIVDPTLYIGIDEVGVGENFGPIIACGSYFKDYQSKIKAIMLGIKDSKKMTLKEIEKVSKEIKEYIVCKCEILTPKEFNRIYKDINNVKKINSLLHNKLHFLLDPEKKYIHVTDAFVTKQKYLEYLVEENKVTYKENLILEPKAEEKYIEVGVSAIIAKDLFNK